LSIASKGRADTPLKVKGEGLSGSIVRTRGVVPRINSLHILIQLAENAAASRRGRIINSPRFESEIMNCRGLRETEGDRNAEDKD